MKKILVMTLLAVLSASSYGVVNVNWFGSYGFFFGATDPGVGILGDGTGNSTTVQLIYSLDDNVNDVNLDGSSAGDDVVWDAMIITEDGIANDGSTFDSYAFTTIQNQQRAFVGGFVYARIFQDNVLNLGDTFHSSDIIALVDITGATPAQRLDINQNTIIGNSIDTGLNIGHVVPEPATAMLLALGAGLAWLVRMKNIGY